MGACPDRLALDQVGRVHLGWLAARLHAPEPSAPRDPRTIDRGFDVGVPIAGHPLIREAAIDEPSSGVRIADPRPVWEAPPRPGVWKRAGADRAESLVRAAGPRPRRRRAALARRHRPVLPAGVALARPATTHGPAPAAAVGPLGESPYRLTLVVPPSEAAAPPASRREPGGLRPTLHAVPMGADRFGTWLEMPLERPVRERWITHGPDVTRIAAPRTVPIDQAPQTTMTAVPVRGCPGADSLWVTCDPDVRFRLELAVFSRATPEAQAQH
ncbi:MAG: hypothetical protein K6U14_03680 [Firmicutes bacterium]|nr:hypothetical protein [Alicyclobacillaceae bacterium]MCL6496721.1 hypothetical protein [Bacillota bacterium]